MDDFTKGVIVGDIIGSTGSMSPEALAAFLGFLFICFTMWVCMAACDDHPEACCAVFVMFALVGALMGLGFYIHSISKNEGMAIGIPVAVGVIASIIITTIMICVDENTKSAKKHEGKNELSEDHANQTEEVSSVKLINTNKIEGSMLASSVSIK